MSNGGSDRRPLGQRVLDFPRGRMGRRIGRGECFDLADAALRGAGARSAADFGPVTREGDYVWGQSVGLDAVQPGDVIQFRDYVARVTVETSSAESWQELTRPHHTAIVARVLGSGVVEAYEQNVDPGGRAVQLNRLYLRGSTQSAGGRTTTVAVSGTIWAYRPQARS